MVAGTRSGQFLVEAPHSVATPESLPADVRALAAAAAEFMRREVQPVEERLEAHEPGLMRVLLERAGEAGLLAASWPQEYGGLEVSRTAAIALTEAMASNLAFAISAGVHAGVASLPLLYFGSPDLRSAYLPDMASGKRIGAFALTEAGAGSDALATTTRAAAGGGGYSLSGAKLWITNGGFADVFTVLARTDDGLTALLVDRGAPGVSSEREERKMGLHGCSTCPVRFEDVAVPADRVVGAPGGGHRAFLSSLNLGRLNIAATASGACKLWLATAAGYAAERRQFGKPIGRFGLVQSMLAEMAARAYAIESVVYRVAGELQEIQEEQGPHSAAEELAAECAIAKVLGSEWMGFAADRALQIFGGVGYSEEYPAARRYRDARVFRIFEGTNEINRLTVTTQILRRIGRGALTLPCMPAEKAVSQAPEPGGMVGAVAMLRVLASHCWVLATPILSRSIEENEVLAGALADVTAWLYAAESTQVRAAGRGGEDASPMAAMLACRIAVAAAAAAAREALSICGESTAPPSPEVALMGPAWPASHELRAGLADRVLHAGGAPW